MRTVRTEPFYRIAEIVPETFDEKSRTFEVVFSTGARVLRKPFFEEPFIEELSLDPEHVRLERLNNGAAFLDSHGERKRGLSDVLGKVVRGTAKVDGQKGMAQIRLSKRAEVEPIAQDILDGIISKVSMGYQIYKLEEVGRQGELKTFRAIDWEPFEISAVPVAADDGAEIRAPVPDHNRPEYDCVLYEASRSQTLSEIEKKEEEERMEGVSGVDLHKESSRQDPEPQKEEMKVDEKRDEKKDLAVSERNRALEILRSVRAAQLSDTFAEEWIQSNLTLDQVRAKVIDRLALASEEAPTRSLRVEVGDGPPDHLLRGAENALLHRFDSARYPLEEEGRPYRHRRLLDLAQEFLQVSGVRTRGMSASEIASLALKKRGGMHTTSDFPFLLENIANKTLRDAYEEAPQTFESFIRRVPVSDFKEISRVSLGDAPSLEKVNEKGEIRYGSLSEAAEKYHIETFAKIISITRKTIVNDDLDAFTRIPFLYGIAGRDLESDLVWDLITSNSLMGDGKPLFHSSHKNLISPGTPLEVDSLGAARKLLRLQTGLDGRKLNLTPFAVMVPTELETLAQKFLVQTTVPTKSEDANPFEGRLQVIAEPRLDDHSTQAWYVIASIRQIDIVELATLDGQRGPKLENESDFDIEGIKIKAVYDLGAKVIDYRGLVKNEGA
ncbi:MAG: Mu-like prophage major head subunit gpT family protein [Deltaproteobacteria bacterium]|nr:Mu-like prophage major head subunit gpT family protein [Deltaproteobacteria bacterium]